MPVSGEVDLADLAFHPYCALRAEGTIRMQGTKLNALNLTYNLRAKWLGNKFALLIEKREQKAMRFMKVTLLLENVSLAKRLPLVFFVVKKIHNLLFGNFK